MAAQPAGAKTPWEILGVAEGASQALIRVAWRRRMRETHPDGVTGGLVSTEEFMAANEAYRILSEGHRSNHVGVEPYGPAGGQPGVEAAEAAEAWFDEPAAEPDVPEPVPAFAATDPDEDPDEFLDRIFDTPAPAPAPAPEPAASDLFGDDDLDLTDPDDPDLDDDLPLELFETTAPTSPVAAVTKRFSALSRSRPANSLSSARAAARTNQHTGDQPTSEDVFHLDPEDIVDLEELDHNEAAGPTANRNQIQQTAPIIAIAATGAAARLIVQNNLSYTYQAAPLLVTISALCVAAAGMMVGLRLTQEAAPSNTVKVTAGAVAALVAIELILFAAVPLILLSATTLAIARPVRARREDGK